MHQLKSYKILQVFPNGCVFRDFLVYSKTFKKSCFLKKDCLYTVFKNPSLFSISPNLFYTKYRNQITKMFLNESTIINQKYPKFNETMSVRKSSIL